MTMIFRSEWHQGFAQCAINSAWKIEPYCTKFCHIPPWPILLLGYYLGVKTFKTRLCPFQPSVQLLVIILRKSALKTWIWKCEHIVSFLYCIFDCWLWPLKAISDKVMEGKGALFFIAMFKMVLLCQACGFWVPLASGPLFFRFDPSNPDFQQSRLL